MRPVLPRALGPLSARDPLAAAYIRLRRVHRAIARWEDYHAAHLLPEALCDEGLQLRRT